MGQFAVHDQVANRYAEDVEHLRTAWDLAAAHAEALLSGSTARNGSRPDEVASRLRNAQYHAHLSAEVGSGMVPPPVADGAHAQLVESLVACRETLGVLAVRAELDELDDETAEFGLHAIDHVRDAFRGVRISPVLLHPWEAGESSTSAEVDGAGDGSGGISSAILWALVAICGTILVAIAVEVLLLNT